MAGINGIFTAGIAPRTHDANDAMDMMRHSYRDSVLHSANEPLRYQAVWSETGLYEHKEPSKGNWTGTSGDIVSVVFDVYAAPTYYGYSFPSEWKKIGSINKSRDIANKHHNPKFQSTYPYGHRFTVDISEICKDLLSYSLVPIGKGTWQSTEFGGLNGGLANQDNVASNINHYFPSWNGTNASIMVKATANVMKSEGTVVESTSSITFKQISIINSVEQYDESGYSAYYDHKYAIKGNPSLSNRRNDFMTLCPNNSYSSTKYPRYFKSVREDEQSENLYFMMGACSMDSVKAGAGTSYHLFTKYRIKIDTSDGNFAFLDDFESHLRDGTVTEETGTTSGPHSSSDIIHKVGQWRVCVQNVSVDYIKQQATNSNGTSYNPITSETEWYRVQLYGNTWFGSSVEAQSTIQWYKIDKEKEHPYGYVRFHWLNRAGGIDSYTAKRDVIEGLTINKDTIYRKEGDRKHTQGSTYGTSPTNATPNSHYLNDSMRGGDTYKGGMEVTNVDARKVNSVYTEPLSNVTSKWLEGLLTSPNVWVETSKKHTIGDAEVFDLYRDEYNSYLQPQKIEYSPVIITNSDMETVNQEKGMVKLNLEYTYSHKVNTQRN